MPTKAKTTIASIRSLLRLANTILHNSPKGEPKWLRASHSHPLGLCNIAACFQIALGVGNKRITSNHLEVVSNI